MIKNFKDKEAEKIFQGFRSSKLPTRLSKVTMPDFRWIPKKTKSENLRLLPSAVTVEKFRSSAFRETPKDKPEVLAVASKAFFQKKAKKNLRF